MSRSVLAEKLELRTIAHAEDDGIGLFGQAVPRRLVHRAAVSEVLLTGYLPIGPDAFRFGAQWPRSHSFYRVSAGMHDPLLVAETVRQVGLMTGHSGYGVPLDSAYIMHGLSYEITPAGLVSGPRPTELLLDVRCGNVRRRGNRLLGLDFQVLLHRDGELVGRGASGFTCTSPTAYRRLRGDAGAGPAGRLPAPVAPGQVGRDDPADVTLAPTGAPDAWTVRSNRDHPVLFDHPVDHIPGMLLLESMRQAALLAVDDPQALAVGLEADFASFAEFDAPATVRARTEAPGRDGTVPVRVVVAQHRDRVAEGLVRTRSLADAALW